MAVAGAGAEIMEKVGAGAENEKLRLRNNGLYGFSENFLTCLK